MRAKAILIIKIVALVAEINQSQLFQYDRLGALLSAKTPINISPHNIVKPHIKSTTKSSCSNII